MKSNVTTLAATIVISGILTAVASAQENNARRSMEGHMMGDRAAQMSGLCPMCGKQWDGRNSYSPKVPDTLPAPTDKEWLAQFADVMAQERLSKAQYEQDSKKYAMHMPYNMIIPQEDDHITWISDLYKAFDLKVPDTTPKTVKTSSGRDALKTGMALEAKLIPAYERLIEESDQADVKRVIGEILYQTRMHHTMFQHALSMGTMMGRNKRKHTLPRRS